MAGILDLLQQLLGGGGSSAPVNRLAMYGQSPGGEGGPVVPRGVPFPAEEMGGRAGIGVLQEPEQVAAPAAYGAPQAAPGAPQVGSGGFLSRLFGDPMAEKRNKTVQWLQGQGLDEGSANLLASEPKMLQQYLFDRMKGNEAQSLVNAGDGQLYDPNTGKWIEAPNRGGGSLKPTAEQQNYEYAMQQLRSRGVPDDKLPSFQEYSKPKSRGIVFTNADGSTVQIGGSDGGEFDGTSLPAELGARIGLGQQFLSEYPEIIKEIDAGSVTGPIDYGVGALTGRGVSGQVIRRMGTGVDALARNLTGAGKSESETRDYTARYLPGAFDDAETLKRKAEGLKMDLEAVATGAIKGKAGKLSDLLPGGKLFSGSASSKMPAPAAPAGPAGPAAPSSGVVDWKDFMAPGRKQ